MVFCIILKQLFLSKNSSPRDILETMRENNCKHMPLIDDYTGNIITIADIRDVVLSTTGQSNAGAGKTERYAVCKIIFRKFVLI